MNQRRKLPTLFWKQDKKGPKFRYFSFHKFHFASIFNVFDSKSVFVCLFSFTWNFWILIIILCLCKGLKSIRSGYCYFGFRNFLNHGYKFCLTPMAGFTDYCLTPILKKQVEAIIRHVPPKVYLLCLFLESTIYFVNFEIAHCNQNSIKFHQTIKYGYFPRKTQEKWFCLRNLENGGSFTFQYITTFRTLFSH